MEKGKIRPNTKGIPQGGVLSPLVSNIYLNELDSYMNRLKRIINKGRKSKTNPRWKTVRNKME